MNAAFRVDLGYYRSSEQIYRSREGYIFVPQFLEPLIITIVGLENRELQRGRRLPPTAKAIGETVSPSQARSTIDPRTVSKFYSFPDNNGTGQTIGILELAGGYLTEDAHGRPTDIDAYLATLRLPKATVVSVASGASNKPAGSRNDVKAGDPDVEVALDIAIAAAVAPAAKIAVYFAPNLIRGFVSSLAAAIHDKVNSPSVISISWGLNESGWTDATRSAFHELLRDAAALGVTVLASSGDDGTNAGAFDGRPHVNYPASDPWVIACGGTVLKKTRRTIVEHSWNDSGGGFSKKYRQPRWQRRVGLPKSMRHLHRHGRGVPDVAGNAGTGYDLIVYGIPTTRLKLTASDDGSSKSQFVGPITGTSAVAPLYAGLIALINERLPEPVGYLNPILYSLGLKPGGTTFRRPVDPEVVTNAYKGTFADPKTGSPIEFVIPGFPTTGNWNPVTGCGILVGTEFLDHIVSLYGRRSKRAK
jgi:kumamolisin